MDASNVLGQLPTAGEWEEWCLEASGRIRAVRVPVATGKSAKAGHHTIIPRPPNPALFFGSRVEWRGARSQDTLGAGAATKPLPSITSKDGELMPSSLTGIHVSWV